MKVMEVLLSIHPLARMELIGKKHESSVRNRDGLSENFWRASRHYGGKMKEGLP